MNVNEALISVQNVTVSYPIKTKKLKWSKYTPLKEISFDVHRGETVGIIGRNGAGKSTLLRMIAGIIEPDGGTIVNRGARVSLLSLGVGFMPHLSGRDNAMLSGMLLGLTRKAVSRRIDAIIEFSGLGNFIEQPLHTYSSGMRARLGFSVAIQLDSDVLLIDETLSVGDEDFRNKSAEKIKTLLKSEKSVVIVSHAIPTLRQLCNTIVWIDNGLVRMTGETDNVIKAYQKNQSI